MKKQETMKKLHFKILGIASFLLAAYINLSAQQTRTET